VTTFTDRPRSALLVIDVQEDVMAGAWQSAEVVARIGALVDRARAEGAPVVWVRHQDEDMPHGSPGWQIVAALQPSAREPIVEKRFRSAFEDTDLDTVLAVLDVGRLVVCGAQSDFCVRHTVHAALERGYDVELVSDAHTTCDAEIDGTTIPAELIVAHQNAATRGYALPSRTSDIATHDQIRLS
jgi:nicotinamidase-related amidase